MSPLFFAVIKFRPSSHLGVLDHAQAQLQAFRARARRLPLSPPSRRSPSEVAAVHTLYLTAGQPGAPGAEVAISSHLSAPGRLELGR